MYTVYGIMMLYIQFMTPVMSLTSQPSNANASHQKVFFFIQLHIITVKSHVQYALVYNTQTDFPLLLMDKIRVLVHNTHPTLGERRQVLAL